MVLFIALYTEYTQEVSIQEAEEISLISHISKLNGDSKFVDKIVGYSVSNGYIQRWEYLDIKLEFKRINSGKL